jgi:hypothetical protein
MSDELEDLDARLPLQITARGDCLHDEFFSDFSLPRFTKRN